MSEEEAVEREPLGVERLAPTGGGAPSLPSADELHTWARELGFESVGVGPSALLPMADDRWRKWAAEGYAGSMAYMNERRLTPAELLPGAKSVIVAGLSYGAANTQRQAAVASYARGQDYHQVLKLRLRQLAQRLCDALSAPLSARVCVDTAPLFERAWAQRLGLGFIGKSTMLITPGVGSSQLLGVLLVDVNLPRTVPRAVDGCGTCRSCLDACPTGAFRGEYVLDARRCISYLTIEHRGSIERSLRPLMGQHVFGCDICQTVCPFNWSRKLPTADPDLSPSATLETLDAAFVLEMSTGDHRRLTRGTALRRASRAQLQRNAAIALGNSNDQKSVPALARALTESRYPVVRGHAAWALGRLGGAQAEQALQQASATESDADVLAEIREAQAS